MQRRTFLLFSTSILLYGCSTLTPQREVNGRFSLNIYQDQRYQQVSGSFSLRQWEHLTQFDILSPLGGILYQIQVKEKEAFLYKGTNTLLEQAPSFSILLEKILGISISEDDIFTLSMGQLPNSLQKNQWRVQTINLSNAKKRILITEENSLYPTKLTLIFNS